MAPCSLQAHRCSASTGKPRSPSAVTDSPGSPILTVFVHSERHIRGEDLIAADLAELRGAVCVHSLHPEDTALLLSLHHGRLVGLLLEHRRVLIHVVHLDVDGCSRQGGEIWCGVLFCLLPKRQQLCQFLHSPFLMLLHELPTGKPKCNQIQFLLVWHEVTGC